MCGVFARSGGARASGVLSPVRVVYSDAVARDVVIEGRLGERLWLRASNGDGIDRAEAARVVGEIERSPIAGQALRGLVFAAGAIDAARLDEEGLRQVLVALLVQGRIALVREAPARESGQEGQAAAEQEAEDEDTPLVSTEWIGIELVDARGEAVAWEPYILELPDGRQLRGKLGADGKALVRGIPGGSCRVTFPKRGARLWDPA